MPKRDVQTCSTPMSQSRRTFLASKEKEILLLIQKWTDLHETQKEGNVKNYHKKHKMVWKVGKKFWKSLRNVSGQKQESCLVLTLLLSCLTWQELETQLKFSVQAFTSFSPCSSNSNSVPQTWAKFSNDNIQRSQSERTASRDIRSKIEALLNKCATAMIHQWNTVNHAYTDRIKEYMEAKQRLHQHLSKVNPSLMSVGIISWLCPSLWTRIAFVFGF